MDVPPWVSALKSAELVDRLRKGNLDEDVVDKVQKKGIAGRHLQKLVSLDDQALERYGLNLGDLLDIVDTLQSQKENFGILDGSDLRDVGSVPSSSHSSGMLTLSSTYLNSTPGGSKDNKDGFMYAEPTHEQHPKGKGTSHTPSSPVKGTDSTAEEVTASPKSNSLLREKSNSFSFSTDVETEDEIFHGFATVEKVKLMSKLERKAAKQQIASYHYMTDAGYEAERPYLHLPGEDGLGKKKKAETSNDSQKIKSPKNNNSRKDKEGNEGNTDSGSESPKKPKKKSSKRERNDSSLDDDTVSGSEKRKKPKKKRAKRERNDSSTDSDNEKRETRKKKNKVKRKKRDKKEKEDGFKVAIPDHLQPFLDADCLDESQKTTIKKYLQNPLNRKFPVKEILLCEAKESGSDSSDDENDSLVPARNLIKNGVVFDEDLRKVVAVLLKYLYNQVSDPSLVTVEVRENLAVSIVATFPKMAQSTVKPTDLPWTWLYDRRNNSGKLAHHHANKQKQKGSVRLRGGGSKKKKARTPKVSEPPPVQYFMIDDMPRSKDAKHLSLIVPDDSERNQIERLMNSTYEERRALMADRRCPTTLILQAFPHLKSFEGRMIDYEFEKLYGQEKGHSLIRNYQDFVPRLLQVAKLDPKKYPPQQWCIFGDSVLNSLLILSKFLPRSKRVYDWEENMNPIAIPDDFVELVREGRSLQQSMDLRREHSVGAVQPYILATGTAKKIESLSVVLGDSHIIKLPRGCLPLRAVDVLIKAHWALSSHFCLGWKNTFRFLSTHIYKLPLENERLSTFTAEYKKLMSIEVDKS